MERRPRGRGGDRRAWLRRALAERAGEAPGPEALQETIRETHGYFDELRFGVDVGPIAEGDLVAARWTGRGSMQGSEVSVSGHDLMRIESGQIVEYWAMSTPPS